MNPSTPPSQRLDLLASLVIILIAALFLIPPLWTPGLVNPGDFVMSVHRIQALDAAWSSGIYYPRLGAEFNFGYGAPLFQYYPPLASYIGLIFTTAGLGMIGAAKAVISLGLIGAGLGAYLYGRFLLRHRLAALFGAVLYMASPYLLMVVYERGAVAEIVAWGLLPWLFWSAHSFYATGRRREGLALAAIVAAVFLAHNATALFIVPGVALYVALLALIERRPRALIPVAAAFLLGAALSAFYWVPAVVEMRFSKAEEFMFNEATDVVNNVVAPGDVVQRSWVPQFAGPERFRFALLHSLLGAAGILVLALRRRQRPAALWLLAAAFLVVLFLQTTWSVPFWQNVPLVRFIQFPWRLHGIASFCASMLAGSLLMDVNLATPVRRWAWIGASAAAAALFVWLGTINMSPAKSLMWQDVDEAGINRLAMWERGLSGYPLWTDYTLVTLPIGSTGYTQPRPADDPSRLPATTTPQITVVSDNPMRTVLDVEAREPWTLRLHRAWFPGWQVRLDGDSVPTVAGGGGGLVSAELPAGSYQVEARLGDSPVRRIASIVSVLALALWITWLVRPRADWIALLIGAGVAIVVALGIRILTVEAKPGLQPVAFRAPLDNGVTLLGYDLNTTRACIGDELHLRTWWHVAETPDADFKFFIHVVTPDDTAKVAQADTFPSDGYVPMTRWESGELVPQEQLLPLDSTIPPGNYQLILGLYDPLVMQNARVLEAPAILPGDRLRLADLELLDCAP